MIDGISSGNTDPYITKNPDKTQGATNGTGGTDPVITKDTGNTDTPGSVPGTTDTDYSDLKSPIDGIDVRFFLDYTDEEKEKIEKAYPVHQDCMKTMKSWASNAGIDEEGLNALFNGTAGDEYDAALEEFKETAKRILNQWIIGGPGMPMSMYEWKEAMVSKLNIDLPPRDISYSGRNNSHQGKFPTLAAWIDAVEKCLDSITIEDIKKAFKEFGDDDRFYRSYREQEFDSGASTEKINAKKEEVIAQLKTKYQAESSGDKYSMENPQLQMLQKFMESGEMNKLIQSFGRTDVVDIISQVFPDVGIEMNEDGSFSIPKGHGDEAAALFDSLLSKVNEANVSNPEIERLKGLISEDSQKLIVNLNKIKNLASQIEQLKITIETEVAEAIEAVKDAEESSKKEAKAAYKEEMQAYSDGKITYDEFEDNVHSRLKGINPNIDNAVRSMHSAERHMKEIKGLQGEIKALNDENALIKANIDKNVADLNVEQAKANALAEKEVDRCDPIGFKNSEGVQFDFFIDSDQNGELTDAQEFLGAKNGWAEMSSQDANGDGKVDVSELQNAGVKVVVTGTDGTQEIKDIADVLGKDDFIDLSSYKAENTDLGNGNIKAGSFNLNMNGQSIEGYQTLDTLDYLKDNYEFTNEDLGTGEFRQDVDTGLDPHIEALSLYANEIKAESFDSMISNLEAKITEGWRVVLSDHDGEIAKIMREQVRPEMKPEDECPEGHGNNTGSGNSGGNIGDGGNNGGGNIPKPTPSPTPTPTPEPEPEPEPKPTPKPEPGDDIDNPNLDDPEKGEEPVAENPGPGNITEPEPGVEPKPTEPSEPTPPPTPTYPTEPVEPDQKREEIDITKID